MSAGKSIRHLFTHFYPNARIYGAHTHADAISLVLSHYLQALELFMSVTVCYDVCASARVMQCHVFESFESTFEKTFESTSQTLGER